MTTAIFLSSLNGSKNGQNIWRKNHFVVLNFIEFVFWTNKSWLALIIDPKVTVPSPPPAVAPVATWLSKTDVARLNNPKVCRIFSINKICIFPRKLTWNPKMEVWKMIFLFKQAIFRFRVCFRECKFVISGWFWSCQPVGLTAMNSVLDKIRFYNHLHQRSLRKLAPGKMVVGRRSFPVSIGNFSGDRAKECKFVISDIDG